LGFKRGGLNFEIFSMSITGGVWYCGDCYGCNLKNSFIKSVFSCDWFGKIYVLIKIMVEIEVEQKII